MRITGGTLCGRKIQCPPGIIRPAMDRMRESLFAVLGPLDGLSFLDLFSGSGVIGLEAYSRGAIPIRCVEKDAGKKEIISGNLSLAEGNAHLTIMPVERFIMSWKDSFNVIFLDPPFDYPYKGELLKRICASKLMSRYCKVLMHFPSEDKLPKIVNPAEASGPGSKGTRLRRSLVLKDRREYGRSIVHFYDANLPEADDAQVPPSSDHEPVLD